MFALVFITVASDAQSFHLGVKAGANLGKISGSSFQSQFNLGYQLGAFAEIGLGKKLGIQPELLFNQTNTTVASGGSSIFNISTGDKINLNYLSIPILLSIKASRFLTFHLGPEYGILMNKNQSIQSAGNAAFKSGDFSLVGGLQLQFGAFSIYGRYNIGLSNISDIQNQDSWKSQTIRLGIGYRIL
jgi:opacity protein-like surface antigen